MTDEQRRALLRASFIGDALRERLERELQAGGPAEQASKVATARVAGPRTLTERRMAATLTPTPTWCAGSTRP